MSGGRFDYQNDWLCRDIVGVSPDYGLDRNSHKEDADEVRKMNMLEDKVISELTFDIFCLIHSYDWYRSGDTGEDIYRKDIATFKNKWFGKTRKDTVKKIIEKEVEQLRKDLLRDFAFEEKSNGRLYS